MWRGGAGHGRAGQAFELVESGVVDRATANSSLRTATGHNRMTRPPRRNPPQEAARGFWIRAWGQREPANQGTGRSNDPARRPDCSRVGWTFPATHAKCNSLRIEHPIRTLTYCDLVTHRSNRDLCLSCESYLLE